MLLLKASNIKYKNKKKITWENEELYLYSLYKLLIFSVSNFIIYYNKITLNSEIFKDPVYIQQHLLSMFYPLLPSFSIRLYAHLRHISLFHSVPPSLLYVHLNTNRAGYSYGLWHKKEAAPLFGLCLFVVLL